MPIVSGQYQSPAWVNDQTPAIDASELNDLCGTVEDLDAEMGPAQDAITALQQDMSNAQADIADAQTDIATLQNTAYIEKTASGSVASFSDGAALPVKDLTAQIVAQQSGSGDPSPSNIRPITGLSKMTVTRTGKNLWSFGDFTGYASYRVDTTNWRSNSVTFSGVTTSTGATVIVTYVPNLSIVRREFPITMLPITVNFGNSPYITFSVNGLADGESLTNVQLEFGSTATDYEPYAGETYTVNWQTEAGTVYGGMLDVTTGLLTMDYGFAETNTNGEFVRYIPGQEPTLSATVFFSGTSYAYYSLPLTRNPVASTVNQLAKCNYYVEQASQVPSSDNHFTIRVNEPTYARLTFVQTSIPNWGVGETSAERGQYVKDYFAEQTTNGKPLQVAWKLSSPVTIQLTDTEVATLRGQNNIWANTGDISVTYRADPSLVIAALEARIAATQNIIAGVETSMVATKNYSIGDLLIVGDALYKATAAIANGGAITVGTNVAATTVAEQLLLLANA